MNDKQQVVHEAERKLREFSEKIETLEEKAKDSPQRLRSQIEYYIGELKSRQRALGLRLQEIKAASGRDWRNMTAGLDMAAQLLDYAWKQVNALLHADNRNS
jgi:hypothetical protein